MLSITLFVVVLIGLNIASAGWVTGGAMVMAAAYVPVLAGLSREETIKIHREVTNHIDRYQPPMAWVAFGTGIVELAFVHQFWQMLGLLLGLAGIASLMLISMARSIPLARQIIAWTPTKAHSLEDLKARWIRSHYLRCLGGALGFLFLISSLLSLLFFR